MLQATKALALQVTPAPCHGLLHLRAVELRGRYASQKIKIFAP